MSAFVNHDIAVVSVLGLEDVAHDRVRSQRLDKVQSCCLKFLSSLISVSLQEVLVKVDLERLS